MISTHIHRRPFPVRSLLIYYACVWAVALVPTLAHLLHPSPNPLIPGGYNRFATHETRDPVTGRIVDAFDLRGELMDLHLEAFRWLLYANSLGLLVSLLALVLSRSVEARARWRHCLLDAALTFVAIPLHIALVLAFLYPFGAFG